MAQYGRWIDLDGNLHYYDTEKGEVIEPKVQEPPLELEYKIYIEPMPANCYECPMYVDKGWGGLRDYCHLDGSIYKSIKYDFVKNEYFYERPDDCPLCEQRGGRAKIDGIIDDYADIHESENIFRAMQESADAVKSAPKYDFSCVTPLLGEDNEANS